MLKKFLYATAIIICFAIIYRFLLYIPENNFEEPEILVKQSPKQEFASQLVGVWYRRGNLDTELTFEPDGKGLRVKFIDDTGGIVMQHFYPHWEIKIGYDILSKENFQYVEIKGYSFVLIEKYGSNELIEPSPEYSSVSSNGVFEAVDHYSEKINTIFYKTK